MTQSLAIAYQMKKKAQKMARGGMACEDCERGSCMMHKADGGFIREEKSSGYDDDDIVSRIMQHRYSKGGKVANDDQDYQDHQADFDKNEFDDLPLDDDLEEHYTGANSGDEDDDHDVVARIMKSRKMKDR